MDGDLSSLGTKLDDLLTQLRAEDSEQAWLQVESTAKSLANGLRVKDGAVDNHTLLGQSGTYKTLTALFQLVLHGSSIPDLNYISPTFELLRVAANLCMEHDENRAKLLDAGLPEAIATLLEGYAAAVPPPPLKDPLPLSILHLKVVRTAIGVLLNASIGYEPIRLKFISLQAPLTMMRLSTALYPPGAWLRQGSQPVENSPKAIEESWILRSSLANWVWRTLSELKEVKDESVHIFQDSDILSLLTAPLLLYTPPHFPPASPFSPDSDIYETLIQADFEAFEESCTLIESLSLDDENVRLALAKDFNLRSERSGFHSLSVILDFIERGDYPSLWQTCPEADRNRMEKEFDMCKAALIKSVVEMSGEELNEHALWDDSEEQKPGGEFICRMVGWIKDYVSDLEVGIGHTAGRDDLIICASLSLGNLARREKVTTVLVSQPHALGATLASHHLLSPSTDIKVKHGVIGLLKHLAQSSVQLPEIQTALGAAGIIQRISESGIWDEKADVMADVVQLGAIGVVKHLCVHVAENAFALVIPSRTPASTGLSQILALVKRSDSVSVKSEGTRVLVNVIRCLWSNASTGGASPMSVGPSPIANGTVDSDALLEKHRKRATAMRAVISPESTSALANLVGRSAKYPLLINEGLVAMSLLSTQRTGAPLVLTAILTPLQMEFPPVPPTEPPSTSTSTNSDVSSPDMTTPSTPQGGRLPTPRLPLDMLVAVLQNIDNPVSFQMETRMNVCSLLIQLSRNSSGDELKRVQDTFLPVLEQVRDDLDGAQENGLLKSITRVLDAWA